MQEIDNKYTEIFDLKMLLEYSGIKFEFADESVKTSETIKCPYIFEFNKMINAIAESKKNNEF